MYAAGQGKVDVMNYLLDRGIDVNQRYKHDTTLMMWAAGYGQLDAVKALVARGGDPSLTDDRGKTALDVARTQRLADVVAYLESVTTAK
jgi:ankyrin repeat protein